MAKRTPPAALTAGQGASPRADAAREGRVSGYVLKTIRQTVGLTQEQLGELVGVRRETIMRLEAGKYNPSLKLAVDISRAVEAPIEEIFLFD